MPVFRVRAPNGSSFDVTVPEGATEQDAIAYVHTRLTSAGLDTAKPFDEAAQAKAQEARTWAEDSNEIAQGARWGGRAVGGLMGTFGSLVDAVSPDVAPDVTGQAQAVRDNAFTRFLPGAEYVANLRNRGEEVKNNLMAGGGKLVGTALENIGLDEFGGLVKSGADMYRQDNVRARAEDNRRRAERGDASIEQQNAGGMLNQVGRGFQDFGRDVTEYWTSPESRANNQDFGAAWKQGIAPGLEFTAQNMGTAADVVAPSLIETMATAGIAGRVVKTGLMGTAMGEAAVAERAAIAAGLDDAGIVMKRTEALVAGTMRAEKGALNAALGTQAVQVTEMNVRQQADAIRFAPIEELRKNPVFVDMESQLGEESARAALIQQLGDVGVAAGLPLNALATFLPGKLGLQPVESALAGGAAATGRVAGMTGVAGRVARTGVKGAQQFAGEAIQGGAEQLAQNIAGVPAGTAGGYFEDVGKNAIMEGVVGFGAGGIAGAFTGPAAAPAARGEDLANRFIAEALPTIAPATVPPVPPAATAPTAAAPTTVPPVDSAPPQVTADHFSNPETNYRVVHGDAAFNDLVESGVVRTNHGSKPEANTGAGISLGARPTAFPSFRRGGAAMDYAESNPNHYIIETNDPSVQPSKEGRHGKGGTMFPYDANGRAMESLDGKGVRVYRHAGDGKYELVYANGAPTTAPAPVAAPAAGARPAPTLADVGLDLSNPADDLEQQLANAGAAPKLKPAETRQSTRYAPREDGETDKAYAKRAIDTMPAPSEKLVDDPGLYFNQAPDAQTVPIEKLLSTKSAEENAKGGDNGIKRMAAAAAGVLGKRDPIEVVANPDGTFSVVDGNGTLTASKAAGLTSLPVRVVGQQTIEQAAEQSGMSPPMIPGFTRVYARASEVAPKFEATLRAIADAIPGAKTVLPGLKSIARSAAKVAVDYAGDASKIKDIVRGTVVISSLADAPAALAQLQQQFGADNVRIKRNALDPNTAPISASGYRDATALVTVDGVTTEVQISTPEMIAAKKAMHPKYRRTAEIERAAAERRLALGDSTDNLSWQAYARLVIRSATPAERAEHRALRKEQAAAYAEAFAASTSRSNSASEMGSESSSNRDAVIGTRLGPSNIAPPISPQNAGLPSINPNLSIRSSVSSATTITDELRAHAARLQVAITAAETIAGKGKKGSGKTRVFNTVADARAAGFVVTDDQDAFYDIDTDTVGVIADKTPDANRALWVAWHERSGHRGLIGIFGDSPALVAEMKRAGTNPTVRKIADALAAERGFSPEQDALAIEEALAELAAAVRTGNWSEIATRYKVEASDITKRSIADVLKRMLRAIRAAITGNGGQSGAYSNEDVMRLLEDAHKRGMDSSATGASTGSQSTRASNEPKYGTDEWDAAVEEALTDAGQTIDSDNAAMKLWSDGKHRIFAMHENGESADEVTSVDMLRSYTPDQLLALSNADAAEYGVTARPTRESKAKPMTSNANGISYTQASDGSLMVTEGAERLRAMLTERGEGSVGRNREGGVYFSPLQAPRVLAAIKGSSNLASRRGEVHDHTEKNGALVGAPPRFNTRGKLPALRKHLEGLATEGATGRMWYEESGKAVLKLVGGDKNEARKFLQLLAIYSPQADIMPNYVFALRAWLQIKAGAPVSVKTGTQDRTAERVVRDGGEWAGEKTNNFYNNLMRAVDPDNHGAETQGVTGDLWMARAFRYTNDAPNDSQYRFMEIETNRLAQKLGWEPQQVQAAVWVALKSRMNADNAANRLVDEASIKRGDLQIRDGQRHFPSAEAQARHRERWIDDAMKRPLEAATLEKGEFHYGKAIHAYLAQVSWEARPGRTAGGDMQWVNDADEVVQAEYQEAIAAALRDESGADLLAKKLGLPFVDYVAAPGVWQGEVAAGGQNVISLPLRKGGAKDHAKDVASREAAGETLSDEDRNPVDPNAQRMVTAYAAIVGRLLRQEGMGWHRPDYASSARDANGFELAIGRPFTSVETMAMYNAVKERLASTDIGIDDVAFIASPSGLRVVNFSGMANPTFGKLLQEAATTRTDLDLEIAVERFRADGALVTNDWEASPDGQDYLRQATEAGHGSTAEWADRVLAPRIESANQDFNERHGRSTRASNKRSGSDAAGDRRARGDDAVEVREGWNERPIQPDAVAITGIHYSNTAGLKALDGSKYGSNHKGAEWKRIETALWEDEERFAPIANRVYFYPSDSRLADGESMVRSTNRHDIPLANLYDMTEDPRGLLDAADSVNEFELAVVEAGFDGYRTEDMAVVMGTKPVPTRASTRNPQSALESIGLDFAQDRSQNIAKANGRTAPSVPTTVNPSETSREEIGLGESFWRWFGKSKVVDSAGNPKVVYHGTTARFDAFKINESDGAFFTGEREHANHFAQNRGVGNGQVLESYLSLQNPLIISQDDLDAAWDEDAVDGENDNPPRIYVFDFIQKAREAGNDGVIVRNMDDLDFSTDVFIAFKPEQIKSATENSGAFDPANPSIRASTVNPVAAAKAEAAAKRDTYADLSSQLRKAMSGTGRMELATARARRLIGEVAAIGDVGLLLKEAQRELAEARRGIDEEGRDALHEYDRAAAAVATLRRAGREAGRKSAEANRLLTTLERAERTGTLAERQLQLERLLDTVEAARETWEAAATIRDWRRGRQRSLVKARQKRGDTLNRLAAEGMPQGNITWTLDKAGRESALRKARRLFQDKMIDVRDIGTAISEALGSALPDMLNLYQSENLMHGKAEEGIEALKRSLVDPLKAAIKAAGLTNAEVHRFLWAQHAEERNKRIAAINPGMPDGGSGMDTARARQVLAEFAAQGKTAQLAAISRRVQAIRHHTLDTLLRSGQITPELHTKLSTMYRHYVPLRGDPKAEEGETRIGSGRGLDVRGKPMQRALGRNSEPRDILGELVGDAERAILQGAKAEVGRTLLRMALAFPNKDVWLVEPVIVEPKYSEATGEVYLAVAQADQESTVVVKHNGKPYAVKLVDPRLRDAVLNYGMDGTEAIAKLLGWANRWMSAVSTRFNPAFVGVNMIRDAIQGSMAIGSELGAGALKDSLALYLPAMKAMWLSSRGAGDASVADAQKSMVDWAREFAEAGGKTGHASVADPETIQQRIEDEMAGILDLLRAKRPVAAVSQALQRSTVIETIERANDSAENALRLAVYTHLRRSGRSKDKAAQYAKNVTINFNRRGQITGAMNALYLFFNASMQGGHRTLQLLADKRVLGTLAGIGAAQGMLAMSAGMLRYEDDDETLWEQIPDYVREKAFVIPLGFSEEGDPQYAAIPMPFGFNLFTMMGGYPALIASDTWRARQPRSWPATMLADVARSTIDAFSVMPLGEEGWFMPTLARMQQNFASNKDDLGNSIRSMAAQRGDAPRAYSGKADTGDIYRSTAMLMNRIGGGDEVTKPVAWLDYAPEDIEYMVGKVTGGAGNTLQQLVRAATRSVHGLDIAPGDIPVTGRLVGSQRRERTTQRVFYEASDRMDAGLDRLRIAFVDGGVEAFEQKKAELGPAFEGVVVARYKTNDREGAYRRGDYRIDTDTGRPTFVAIPGSTFDAFKNAKRKSDEYNDTVRATYTSDVLSSKERAEQVEALQIARAQSTREFMRLWNEAAKTR